MTGVDQGHLAWLVVVDVFAFAGGIGALVAIGMIRSWFELAARGGVALLAGLLVSGIVEAHLALVGVPISLGALAVIAFALVAAGAYRWRRQGGSPDARLPRRATGAIAPLALGVVAVEFVHVAAAAAVRPMAEWDSWAIWGTKARDLTLTGSVDQHLFANRAYEVIHLDYPILQPTIEALALRGGWDPGMAHLQLVVLVAAALWAMVGLCHGRVPLEIPALGVVFLAFQPWFVNGLLSGYADVPVAVVSICALLALLRFVLDGDRRVLVVGALFAGGAGLIKNEGTLFVLAGFAAVAVALVVARRPRALRPLALALVGAAALWAPWRIYVAYYALPSIDFNLGDAVRPSFLDDQFYRVGPSSSALWGQVEPSHVLAPASLLVAGLIAAALARRFAIAIAVAIWSALVFAGLVAIYWISIPPLAFQIYTSVSRVTTTLLVGGVMLGALAAGEAFRDQVLARAERVAEEDGVELLPQAGAPTSLA